MDWAHNLVLVRKPNGKLRVCLDPRTINKALRFNIHNAKTFSELTSRIGKVMYVNKIDANSGFWTLPMDPDSQLLTTFNTPWGRFCFLKMPFGLNQSQYFIQFWMDYLFWGDLNEGTQVIADDMKIHGLDEATHDKHLIQVLNQCRKVSLKLNAEKCIFKAESILFFGHVISRDGIKPDPKKMDAIRTIMTPMSKLELQSFLGLCNYLVIYVPSLSAVLQPLRELTKKDTDFQWNSQYDILYQQAKDHILENWQTLCYYDQDLPVSIETYASQSGLGAVLLQEGRPVAFMSKALTDTQSRYSNIEHEILGEVTGVKHFHQYLFGKQFILYTDHKPIENLVLKPLVDTTPRVQRLMLRLSQDNMNVQYKAGKHLLLSDCLSRLSNPATQEEDESLNLHVNMSHPLNLKMVTLPFITLSNVCEALMEDPISVLLGDLILNGWLDSCKDLDQELKPYWIHRFNLSIVDGIILLGEDCIVVPYSITCTIFESSTLHSPRNHKNLQEQGTTHIGQELPMMYCNFVVNVKFVLKTTLIHHFQTLNMLMPMDQHLSMVLILAKLRDIPISLLLITIHLQCLNIYLPSLATTSVITAFKTIFSDTGVPMTLVTDNALCFTSEEFEEFAKSWNFTHITSSPRYPKGNAHAEKAVGMVKQIYNHCEDPLYGMLILKTVPLLDVKESPDKIFFGWSLHTNLAKPGMVQSMKIGTLIRTLKEMCQTLKILL